MTSDRGTANLRGCPVTAGPAGTRTSDITTDLLHPALEDPVMSAMTFLNEAAARYPDAVPFAAGRPTEEQFDVDDLHRHLRRFCDHLTADLGRTPAEVRRVLFQYGRTKGVVHELVARHLSVDEGIEVDSEAIVVTVGCQEAIYLVLRALRADDRDVVLAVRPTYVGLTGAARLVDVPVIPVREDEAGIDLDDLVAQIRRAQAAGLRPRACYVIPDFANPSGASLGLAARRRLLAIAEREQILLLEDNPYGMFGNEVGRVPTLKALDRGRHVIHLGSFAKTALPGARVGYVVADQRVADRTGDVCLLADQLAKIKSMVTVNTSPITQAVVGGRLLEHRFSLLRATVRERRTYRANLRRIADGLARRFPAGSGVSWNTPAGGFFIVVTVPFTVDNALLEESARAYGVLWTPMRHFYGGYGGDRQLRLSASAVTADQIESGLDRLADLIRSRMGSHGTTSP